MNDERPPLDTDPERLEEGLRRLRALGYLQSPAESYVAARVVGAGSRRRSAAAAGVWIGGGGGVLVALLLLLSAVVVEPSLLDRPRGLIWLWLDMTVLMVVLGGFGVGLTALILLRTSDRSRVTTGQLERPLVWLPGAIGSLYLADRLGRATLADATGAEWGIVVATVAVVVGFVGALASWSLSGALALARLQGTGVFRAPRLRRWERPLPLVVFSVTAALVLGFGPYRGLDPLPRLGEVEVTRRGPSAAPMLVVAADGVTRSAVWPGDGTLVSARAVSRSGVDHPAAYWNELATGFPSLEHGLKSASAAGPRGFEQGLGDLRDDPVLDVLVRHLLPGVGLGRTVASDRRDLRRPPFWEILARAGVRSRVVNWWATYPTVEMPGLEIVSDRHFLRLYDGREAASGLVWPPDLAVEAIDAWKSALRDARDELPGVQRGREWIAARGVPGLDEAWDLATAADLYHVVRAHDADPSLDLIVVHLNGADIVHRALDRAGIDPEVAAPLLAAHEAFLHELLDRLLADPRREVVGILRGTDGVPWVVGPAEMPRDAREWAPWFLWSFGVVPATDMDVPSGLRGSPLPARRPPTYGAADPPAHTAERSGDDLERLRSLGYVDG